MEKYYRVSDVDAIVEKLLREPYYQHDGESWYSGVSAMADALTFVTPMFVEEPKVSKWIDSDPAEWQCSRCKYKVERWNNTLYCPACGAKMKVE
jgi:rubrerythrin